MQNYTIDHPYVEKEVGCDAAAATSAKMQQPAAGLLGENGPAARSRTDTR